MSAPAVRARLRCLVSAPVTERSAGLSLRGQLRVPGQADEGLIGRALHDMPPAPARRVSDAGTRAVLRCGVPGAGERTAGTACASRSRFRVPGPADGRSRGSRWVVQLGSGWLVSDGEARAVRLGLSAGFPAQVSERSAGLALGGPSRAAGWVGGQRRWRFAIRFQLAGLANVRQVEFASCSSAAILGPGSVASDCRVCTRRRLKRGVGLSA